jgi:hypothetical protein
MEPEKAFSNRIAPDLDANDGADEGYADGESGESLDDGAGAKHTFS